MNENYSILEKTLENAFKGTKISGQIVYDPQVKLIHVEEGTWRNFWTKRATYKITSEEKTDEFGSLSCYMEVKLGELVVIKKKDKLLIDLMTRYKTLQDKTPIPLTLENRFKLSLN